MNIQPTATKLIVAMEWVEPDKTTESGIILAGNPKKKRSRPDRGVVVACGPDVKNCKEGDKVFFQRHSGDPIMLDDELKDAQPEHYFFDDAEIWGIVND